MSWYSKTGVFVSALSVKLSSLSNINIYDCMVVLQACNN